VGSQTFWFEKSLPVIQRRTCVIAALWRIPIFEARLSRDRGPLVPTFALLQNRFRSVTLVIMVTMGKEGRRPVPNHRIISPKPRRVILTVSTQGVYSPHSRNPSWTRQHTRTSTLADIPFA
jgi:hypothetical protein